MPNTNTKTEVNINANTNTNSTINIDHNNNNDDNDDDALKFGMNNDSDDDCNNKNDHYDPGKWDFSPVVVIVPSSMDNVCLFKLNLKVIFIMVLLLTTEQGTNQPIKYILLRQYINNHKPAVTAHISHNGETTQLNNLQLSHKQRLIPHSGMDI